jgi:hypothetical protein
MDCLTLSQILLTAALAAGHSAQTPHPGQASLIPSQSRAYRNTEPGMKYLGSKVCAECHKQIYEAFSKTDMGRSMSGITPSWLEELPATATITAKDLNRSFQVYRQG